MRLFVAGWIPGECVESPPLPSALRRNWRAVAPQRLHVTYAFLGTQPETLVDAFVDALASSLQVDAPQSVRLGDYGVFPHPGRARVLWRALGPARELTAIAEAVRSACETVGTWRRQRRPFRPHLTLGRWRQPPPSPQVRSWLSATNPVPQTLRLQGPWLVASHLTSAGPRYETLGPREVGEARRIS